jgi:hypothetical protein
MLPRLVEAKYKDAYTIWIRFADGVAGDVDLKDDPWGEVFEPLKTLSEFRKYRRRVAHAGLAQRRGLRPRVSLLQTAPGLYDPGKTQKRRRLIRREAGSRKNRRDF